MSIKVLMVTDAEGSYQKEGQRFGLTELVEALEQGNLCKVTKAHRYPEGWVHTENADIHNFKFDNTAHFNPDNYDEVWLMGFASNNPQGPYGDVSGYALTISEIEKLSLFMNNGGGVFATGDHDDLGKDLCGSVPRVRSMRQWDADYSWWSAYQNNPEVDLATVVPDFNKSPPPVGPYRLDTLQTGHNTHYEFQDQSDDVPQHMHPVMHAINSHTSHAAGGTITFNQSLPHPVLCGMDGVIDVLPDHMHEGRCYVPDNLSGRTFTAGGQSRREYPDGPGGTPISPEVAAWGKTNPRATDPNFTDPEGGFSDSNTPVFSADFADIVAYNGHRADVGRVVVDSTFHHFVNINVSGVDADFSTGGAPADAVKDQGFYASPEGVKQYGRIKEYWRNIARWIARPNTLSDIAWHAFRDVAYDPRLKQTTPLGTFEKVPSAALIRYGASAFTLMRERFGTCTVFSFVVDIAIPDPLSYLLSYAAYIKLTLPDPPPYERLREELVIDKFDVVCYALGAAMLALRQPEQVRLYMSGKLDSKAGLEVIRKAAIKGAERGLTEQAARMDKASAAIREALSIQSKAVKKPTITRKVG